MVNQILNTPCDLTFAGKWLGNQFALTPKKKKDKVKVKELEKEISELKAKGGKTNPELEKQIKKLEGELAEAKKGGDKSSPLLKKQLDQLQKDLNLILNKWKFGDTPINSAQEFLNQFEPWINKQMAQKKEVQELLEEQGASNLTNLKETWKNTEADYLRRIKELGEGKEPSEELEKELRELKKDNQQKERTINELEKWSQGQHNRILELEKKGTAELSEEQKEKLAEYEDLITERDEAIREKKTLEQQILAQNNQLKNKQAEVNNKENALEKLKKETSEKEISLNRKLTEKNGLITTLNQEIKQHKSDLADYKKQHQELREKYTKREKLLDTEQLECKRLEEENEKLQEEIKNLKK